MKKILVPTDFSGTAKNAYLFALDLAEYWDASVNLVHAFHPQTDPMFPYMSAVTAPFLEEKKGLLRKFRSHTMPPNDGGVATAIRVETDIAIGFAAEEIIRLSNEVDLIVMGTTGDSGIFNKLFGSVSLAVAKKAKCPVMLIPNGVKFRGFKSIMYAGNYESAHPSALRKMMNFASRFQANVHFVHVMEPNEKIEYFRETESRIFDLLFGFGEPSFAFYMTAVRGDTVPEGLDNYVIHNNIDLTVMVSPKRTFWENVFHKSITKAMALNTSVPILVYHTD